MGNLDKGSLVEYEGKQYIVSYIDPMTRRAHFKDSEVEAPQNDCKTLVAARFM